MQPKPDGDGNFNIHLTKADAKTIADLQSCCRLQPELEGLQRIGKIQSELERRRQRGKSLQAMTKPIHIPAGIYYTPQCAANALAVDESTIRRWVREHYLKAVRPSPRVILIPRAEVYRAKKEQRLTDRTRT